MNRRCSIAMACLLLFAAPPAGAVGTVPAEPAAYRQDNYREPTPATVNGCPSMTNVAPTTDGSPPYAVCRM